MSILFARDTLEDLFRKIIFDMAGIMQGRALDGRRQKGGVVRDAYSIYA